MRRLAVACVATLVAVAVGCGDPEPARDSGDPADRGASATGAQPPTLPRAARNNSVAGAKAFIRYYWDVKNYAQATGDTAPLRAAATAECNCKDEAWFIEQLFENGSRIKGGEYAVREISAPSRLGAAELSFVVRVHTAREVITRGEAEGRRLVSGPGRIRNQMIVVYEEDGWRLDFNDIHETGAS